MKTPVEFTAKYATMVDDLAEAWSFVMDRIDLVGPDPSVSISPTWIIPADEEDETLRRFEVVVSGMVYTPETAP